MSLLDRVKPPPKPEPKVPEWIRRGKLARDQTGALR